MTNFNDGGRLAVCTGNIVRNLYEGSETNPDLDTLTGLRRRPMRSFPTM